MLHVTDQQRRDRLGVRHALAPAHRVDTPEQAVAAVTVLHATEPATVHLSCWARGHDITRADVERALHTDRSLVKQLAMRRTLWVFPRDLLPAAWGSASARVAVAEGRRIAKDVVAGGLADDGEAWLARARAGVLEAVAASPDGLTAVEVRAAVPELASRRDVPATAWTCSRVLTHLGLTAHLVRGVNTQHWRLSRPRWTATAHWLGGEVAVPPPSSPAVAAAGWAEIVRRWLRSAGPCTEADLVWWLGSTKAAVRAALADLEAVEVALDAAPGSGAATGWLLPDDLDPVEPPAPWVALLPVLDPATMGWRGRAWHLGDLGPLLFDRNGNAGTTAWVDGRVVGCWVQDDDAVVRVRLVADPATVGAAARAALLEEAERLTTWLAGERVGTVYPSPAMRDDTLTALGSRP